MSSCTRCESTRLVRMVMVEAPANVNPFGILCFECGQVQGTFPIIPKIPLGSILAEPCATIQPGEKGMFRLLDHIGGSTIDFGRMSEAEALWHGAEPLELGALAELTFFDLTNPLAEMHATLAESPGLPQEFIKDMLEGKQIVLVNNGEEEPWIGQIVLELPEGAKMVKNAKGETKEIPKQQMSDVQSPFASIFAK